MKRVRLGMLMPLIVIAALGTTVVMQQVRAARREADLEWFRMAYSQLLAKQPRADYWEPFLKRYREEWAKRELKNQAEKGRESE
jgi:hypothetical protein